MTKSRNNKLSFLVLITVMLSLTLFFVISPHVTLNYSPLKTYFYLPAFYLFVTLLLVSYIIRRNKEREFIYDLIFTILLFASGFFFIVGNESIFATLKSSRALQPLITTLFLSAYSTSFVVVFLNYLLKTELVILEGRKISFDFKLFKRKSPEQRKLIREAQTKRINEMFSPLYFYLIVTATVAIAYFSSALFSQKFTIPLGGDFTQQQIPFYTNGYDDWWRFLKTGQFPLWDSNTFLGASNVGSNSFYYAMNPFFLPILLFPRDLIPQGISVLMIMKFTLAAFTMRTFLKYMGVNERESRIFGLVYAFAGWNSYYLWFNHFMEVAVLFPLIFLGIEKVLKEKKIKTLIFALALLGFANYFFLVTAAIVGFIYAFFRYLQLFPKIKGSDKLTVIGLGFIGFLFGILASSVVLFPSLSIALGSDRVTDATYLDNLKEAFNLKNYKEAWEIITKWEYQNENYVHKKFYPLISFYFPVFSNRSVTLLNTSSYDNTISSIFVFSPVILLFIPSIIVSLKKKKFSHLIPIAFFLFTLFTPFFYNMLHGFSKEYGRWQLIVVFSLITYVATSFEDVKKLKPIAFDLSFLINLVLMAYTIKKAYELENSTYFGELMYREYIIYYQFFMFFIAYILMRRLYKTKYEHYARSAQLAFEIVVMGTITIFGHGIISYTDRVNGGLSGYNEDVAVIRTIQDLDGSYYRIYNTRAVKGHDNLPMRENYNGLSAFHSLYNFELMEFNEWSRINYNYNGWSLGIHERRSLLYDFLSVNYYVISDDSHVIKWTSGSRAEAPYKNVPNTYELFEEASTESRFVYRKKDDARFAVGFGVENVTTYQEKHDDELLDVIKGRGRFASVEFEELYLNAALLSYDDLATVKDKYPTLETQELSELSRKNYTYLSLSSPYFQRNIWQFNSKRYPYEANSEGKNKPLPTREYIEENATLLASYPAQLSGNIHAIEYERRDGKPLLASENGGEIIVNLPLSIGTNYSYRYNVFLYDENLDLITFDNHTNVSSSSRTWKVMRSYHSPKPVQKIALIPIGSKQNPPLEHAMYIYEEETLNEIRANSVENSLQNVDVFTNKIKFSTNYEEEKFVVTTIPYDKGWQVITEHNEKIPVYKVQGGFVGFVSKSGPMNYTLKFIPEHFQFGLLVSSSVFLMIAIIELVVLIKKHRKKALN